MAKTGRNGTEKRRGPTDLKALIHVKYPELPENQRKVADFLLQHMREAPFLSVLEIEKQSGASKATVVRLAQSLGFSGFLELRSRLLKRVQSQIRQIDIFPAPPAKRGEETLTLVAHQDIRNISQTVSHLDRGVFTKVAGMIVDAPHVYTVGLGISSLMARTLAYSLNQVAVKATPFVHDSETFVGQLPFVRQSDLVIAFSFPPYSRETVDLAKAAAARHIRVIGITDKLTSPISFHCIHVLPIQSQNRLFTNSFSAISVLINALATEVALQNRPKAVKALKVTERLLHETGHYVPE
ncbi:MAG: Transcriptional regulator [Bacteroidetes bacterium]|jgi:DNA-binding MurR/RpiR family transcriptional regulator|nr:Transcriptional regulator [Bacteroidota bacterium]